MFRNHQTYNWIIRCLCCITVVILLMPAVVLAEQQDITGLFNKMKQARRSVSYSGEVRIERLSGDTINYVNKRVIVNPRQNFFFEEALLQPEVQRQLMMHWRGMMGQGRGGRGMNLRWNQEFQRNLPAEENFADFLLKPELLQMNYTVAQTKGEPVAGRQTILMDILPNYEMRPANRIWVDEKTGVILRREIYASQNPAVPLYREEIVSFEISKPDEIDSLVRTIRRGRPPLPPPQPPPARTEEYGSTNALPPKDRANLYLPAFLPPGFVLDKIRIIRQNRNTIYHQVYTDGLVMFSLFQLPGNTVIESLENDPRTALFLGGNRNPYGSIMLVRPVDNTCFVIIGSARRELLEKVIDSVPGKEYLP